MIKDFKTCVFEQLSKVGKAFSNHNRIELLELLAQGERTVDVLAKIAGLSVANTSQHLQLLRNAGLVTSIKKGQYVHYRLSHDSVMDILINLRVISEQQIGHMEKMLDETMPAHSGQTIIVAEDLEKIHRENQKEILVVDVRPETEYASGHIENAINIPFDELENRIEELPKDKEIVAYCRGPYCLLARESVKKFTDQGYKARRLQEGYTQWKQAGHI